MVHSIELLLDDRTEDEVRQQWTLLAEAGLPSEHRPDRSTPPSRPHITMIACADIDPDLLGGIAEVVRAGLPLQLTLGAPMIFGRVNERRPGLILVRQVLASVALLRLQRQVAEGCPPAVDRHFDAGGWAPHITMGRRYAPDQVGQAVRALAGTRHDLSMQAVGCRYWRGDLKQATDLV